MYASVTLRIPERLTSIPFVVYGSDNNFFPLVDVRTGVPAAVTKRSLFGFLFDVVPRTRIVVQVNHSSESVQTISDRNVKRSAEDAVSLLRVSDHLGVAPWNVEYDRISSTSDLPTHFNVWYLNIRCWATQIGNRHMRPTQWFTLTNGLLNSNASVLATKATD